MRQKCIKNPKQKIICRIKIRYFQLSNTKSKISIVNNNYYLLKIGMLMGNVLIIVL